MTIGDLITT